MAAQHVTAPAVDRVERFGELFSGAALKFSLLRVGELTWPVALSTQMWASGARWGLAQAQYDQTRVRSAWGSIYTDVLKNLVLAARDAETRTPKPNNSIAQLKIYTAFVFSQTSYLRKALQYREIISKGVYKTHFGMSAGMLVLNITSNRHAIATRWITACGCPRG